MQNKYLKLGAKPSDLPYIKAFERWATGIGMEPAKQETLIKWGCNQPRGVAPELMIENFYGFAATQGIDFEEASLVEAWREGVNDSGLPAERAPSGNQADIAKELAEIRQLSRDDPDKYNAAVQDRELELLEMQAGAKTSPDAAPPREQSAAVSRLEAIRQSRREDPESYESNKALQAEELSLLTAQITPAGADSHQPTQEGSDAVA